MRLSKIEIKRSIYILSIRRGGRQILKWNNFSNATEIEKKKNGKPMDYEYMQNPWRKICKIFHKKYSIFFKKKRYIWFLKLKSLYTIYTVLLWKLITCDILKKYNIFITSGLMILMIYTYKQF